jgi:hypothetical protein
VTNKFEHNLYGESAKKRYEATQAFFKQSLEKIDGEKPYVFSICFPFDEYICNYKEIFPKKINLKPSSV